MVTEFDYNFDVKARILDIQRSIENPPKGTQISRERLAAEVQAGLEWIRTNKGVPTTGDTAILKYYPLPEKPTPQLLLGKKNSGRKYGMPRILAGIATMGLQALDDGSYPITDRQAWNRLPEVADGFIDQHTHCEATSRGTATLTIASQIIKSAKDIASTVTFKQFAKAWENQKSLPEKRKEAAEIKRMKEEAQKVFIRKGLLPKQ